MQPPQDDDSLSAVEFGLAGSTQLTEKSHRGKNPQYFKVRRLSRLRKAWYRVYQNGIVSKCEKTQQAVKDFSLDSENHLNRIYRELLHDKWTFMPARGTPITRPGKKQPRPIVVAPIQNRIVQRSILDVLQEESSLEPFYKIDTSFGGIKSRGVRNAIESCCNAIENGLRYYIRSDIKDFFTKIPRETVIETISTVIKDQYFIKLLEDATKTELSNMAELKQYEHLFPLYEVGVAQGCCLSPLLGNILLHEFDRKMNGRGVVCLRYIDDFVILGRTPSSVKAAFNSARDMLHSHGLDIYDPDIDTTKAQKGEVGRGRGLEFLGCEIFPGLINPNRKTRQRILENIGKIFHESIIMMPSPDMMYGHRRSVSETLTSVSNVLKGWGNQYSFCTDRAIMEALDEKIDVMLYRYLKKYRESRDKLKRGERRKAHRRMLGVHLLTDSRYRPIKLKSNDKRTQ